MNSRPVFAAALLAVVLLPLSIRAQESRPFQLALVTPAQIFPDETEITGLRLSILYGRNAGMVGADVGLVTHTTGDATAVQWAGVNIVGGDATGWQQSLVNYNKQDFRGLGQAVVNYTAGELTGIHGGVVNYAAGDVSGLHGGVVNVAGGALEGVQWGLYNQSQMTRGFQLGLVNFTRGAGSLLQIGLVNIISGKDRFPVTPIVNWSTGN
ncbi:MAG: hypothetical protein GWM92_00445 [Gemmatimonadetes bacterium]|nr:hypothetical protein [Gemmatimonadota bacterium]NIR81402.1 hypothetical protein [Gemmatimonadota bacterium]NIT85430.1 hypothetical protein [Gemmatimonadota bacterium]NIU34065.1 hypothetical protein [Gemmatimonadota bacterium]NIU38222.1 hypothetical protein [Gemmatimonadota bacterium]